MASYWRRLPSTPRRRRSTMGSGRLRRGTRRRQRSWFGCGFGLGFGLGLGVGLGLADPRVVRARLARLVLRAHHAVHVVDPLGLQRPCAMDAAPRILGMYHGAPRLTRQPTRTAHAVCVHAQLHVHVYTRWLALPCHTAMHAPSASTRSRRRSRACRSTRSRRTSCASPCTP